MVFPVAVRAFRNRCSLLFKLGDAFLRSVVSAAYSTYGVRVSASGLMMSKLLAAVATQRFGGVGCCGE